MPTFLPPILFPRCCFWPSKWSLPRGILIMCSLPDHSPTFLLPLLARFIRTQALFFPNVVFYVSTCQFARNLQPALSCPPPRLTCLRSFLTDVVVQVTEVPQYCALRRLGPTTEFDFHTLLDSPFPYGALFSVGVGTRPVSPLLRQENTEPSVSPILDYLSPRVESKVLFFLRFVVPDTDLFVTYSLFRLRLSPTTSLAQRLFPRTWPPHGLHRVVRSVPVHLAVSFWSSANILSPDPSVTFAVLSVLLLFFFWVHIIFSLLHLQVFLPRSTRTILPPPPLHLHGSFFQPSL